AAALAVSALIAAAVNDDGDGMNSGPLRGIVVHGELLAVGLAIEQAFLGRRPGVGGGQAGGQENHHERGGDRFCWGQAHARIMPLRSRARRNPTGQGGPSYSLRRVSAGSMRRIRRAGARLARTATASRIAAVAAKVTGSVWRPPHSMARRNRTAMSDRTSPAPMPARESRIPGRMAPAMVWRAVAPSARRMPISCRRWVMDCEIRP